MSEPEKAIFLSYASQDAEAARRIAEALRAAGLEVWFDQNELVGGDAWDRKIRQQIKECALFVPIISANTNARAEGYFRLEWKLAVDRSHLLADDHPFLFPIVMGDVSDATARVPDKFREVQWTRLRFDETPTELAKRVTRLLSRDVAGVTDPGPGSTSPATSKRRKRDNRPAWLRYSWQVIGLIFVVYYAMGPIWKPWFRDKGETRALPAANSANVPASADPTVSEARRLVDKAYALMHKLDGNREDYRLAEDYCQRALKLDPDDGEVWAALSQVNAAYGYRGWDRSLARREQTRVTAERAIRLSPRSVSARMAQAGAWAAFGINRDEQEKLLREIVREEPENQHALHFLAGMLAAKPGGLEECLALNERSAALPGGDPLALFNNARYLWGNDRPAEAYAVLLRSLAQRPFSSALVFKMAMEVGWRGDLAAAETTLRQIPQSEMLEDRANYFAGLLRYYQRNAEGALEIWQAFPRDYYEDFLFEGPKGLLLGLAYELDHRAAAARSEWLAALQVVEKRIATAPNKPTSYYSQAYLLACLGEQTKADAALRTYEQLVGLSNSAAQPMSINRALVYTRLGRFDEIFAHPPVDNLNFLWFSPDFDPLRADPRFQQLLATAHDPIAQDEPETAQESGNAVKTGGQE